jgi:amino acid transporter
MDYFERAFPSGLLAGTLSVVYLLTLAVTVALVAKSFGAYAANLFGLSGVAGVAASGGFATLAILVLAYVNMAGSGAVGRLEVFFVGFKLLVIMLLVVCGLRGVDVGDVGSLRGVEAGEVFGSVGLTFFAYAGYGMMANTAGSLRDPGRTLPVAIFVAIGVVMALYMVLSFVVLRAIGSPEELAGHADTVLAEVARPLLGVWGGVAVSVAALIASASAINATFFSFLNISRGLAGVGQLPGAFGRRFWREGSKGFAWSVVGMLLVTNLFNLEAIANIASAAFLVCYLAVFVAHWRLRRETGSRGWVIAVGFALMAAILVAFVGHVYRAQPAALFVLAAVFAVSYGIVRWVRG